MTSRHRVARVFPQFPATYLVLQRRCLVGTCDAPLYYIDIGSLTDDGDMPSPVLAATVTDGYGHATWPYKKFFRNEKKRELCFALNLLDTMVPSRKPYISELCLTFSCHDQFPCKMLRCLSEAYWDMTIDDSGMIYMVDWYKIRQRPR